MSDLHQDHDPDHEPHAALEDPDGPVTPHEILEIALRELLIEKEVFTAAEVSRVIEMLETRNASNGARLISRIWTDAEFRRKALGNGKAAVEEELGFDMIEAPELIVLENQPKLHHVVVCTLCSCYPLQVLGASPTWYRSKEYRARVVREPRAVLAEFGTELPGDVEIRVVDSTAEVRYLIVPLRPAGTEGWSRERLEKLVSRDSMIGVAPARPAGG
jgi:nitrile hydratase